MKRITTLALLCVAFLGVQSAMAWGGWGHHITAYIAEHHLTPEAKAKCQHYLKHNLPHYSSWQDYWRNSHPFEEITHWHMNRVNKDFETIGSGGKVSRDAVTQINRIVKEMEKGKYKQMSDSLVAVNLKLLIHMVGDMHCPSHVVYTKDFGLPKPSMKIKGKKCGHHKFWDASPQYMHPKWKADRFVKAYDTYTPKEIKKICKGTPYKWAVTSLPNAERTFELTPKGSNVQKYTKDERVEMRRISDEEILKAGYRLAALLNDVLK